ncbi:long-chain fatty acid--CoA ligase [Demequina sp. NBRC 110056]|uniref:AMP-dependent synthetase/ligase n=1 Tax=Demequina sp. NBRC 110056 TaxID=1570345 RepID=UPI0009FF988B|nr:long-chain fatty acid--CoA ligase [Demequina sp. NBRC 110056]
MRTETHTPAIVTIDDTTTLATFLAERAAEFPDRAYSAFKGDGDAWTEVSLQDFHAQVVTLAKGLVAQGVAPGARVGLQASTRHEWAALDFAIQTAGAVTVPIYPTASAAQVAGIHRDATLALAIGETDEQVRVLSELDDAPQVLHLDAAERGAIDVLTSAGASVSDADLASRGADVRADDIATIVYTSGTTGEPRGVALTHRNFVEHALNASAHPDFGTLAHGEPRILLFLPLAHVLARHIQILGLACGAVVGFAPSTKTLAEDLRTFRPTWMMAVPRVLETFYNVVEQRADSKIKHRLFSFATGMSRRTSDLRLAGEPPTSWHAIKARAADLLILDKVREALGGNLRYVVCGGSRLDPELARFYLGLGVTVMEGYGATETAAPLTCNPPSQPRPGTVGIPYPGCSARIAEDGEVLAKGPNVFAGYYGRPEDTAAVMDDGWYRTGDLGAIDEDGYLAITGRKKEILITAGGKNVQPATLEDAIRPDALVQEVVVVGDDKPFIGALIALDEAMLPAWLQARGLPSLTLPEAIRHPDVRAHLQAAVDRANALVSRAESIREWRVLPHELTEQAGELSAALKVRRRVVAEHFKDVIADIYQRR